jgi:hypothetical protein
MKSRIISISLILWMGIEKNSSKADQHMKDKRRRGGMNMEEVNERKNWIISDETLKSLEDTTLFYPCSGNDFFTPFYLFSPHVTTFWFVDVSYFSSGHQNSIGAGLDLPANKCSPLLDDKDYQLLDTRIEGEPDWDQYNRDIDRCVRTEIYKHIASGRTITIHRRRGYGFTAFDTENLGKLGVFFYRGDSGGEGGSPSNRWFRKVRFKIVTDKLCENGIIVTDGSNSDGKMKNFLGKYNWEEKYPIGQELIDDLPSFQFDSKTFQCVGYAGKKYGPTAIWRVERNHVG